MLVPRFVGNRYCVPYASQTDTVLYHTSTNLYHHVYPGNTGYVGKHFGPEADPGTELQSVRVHRGLGRYVTPGNSGVWEGDYGWGYAALLGTMSSVRYRTRLGDLKNKQTINNLGVPTRKFFSVQVQFSTGISGAPRRLVKAPGRVPCPLWAR